jgi:hypothetical protein
MVKKEFLALIKPILQRFSLLLLIPLVYILKAAGILPQLSDRFISPLFLGTFMCVVIWLAANFGLDVFKEEHTDNAFEYLLTFPLPAWRIIKNKLWPRMLVITVLSANLAWLFIEVSDYKFYFFYEGIWFVILCVLILNQLFLFGYFISYVYSKPLRLGLFILTFATFAVFTTAGEALLSARFNPNKYMIYLNIVGLLILLFLYLISRWSMNKFDFKSVAAYNKFFTTRVIVIFVMLDGLGLALILT